jgi:PAS domain S-box-containing protein
VNPDFPASLAAVVDGTPATGAEPVPILIVNDASAQRTALRAVLAPLGCDIVEADSGLEALRCVMAQDFAVILLDVRMPDMDGFETAALIRQRAQSEMTPLIFITAYGSDELAPGDLYSQGAVDFIFAPVPPDELRAKVSVFANLFARAQVLAARTQEVQASADEFWLLTDAAPIGIFQTDAQNRYVYTNPQWSEITGIPPEEAAGQDWATIIGAETRAGLIADLANHDVTNMDVSHRIQIQAPDAEPRIALVSSKAIRDTEGGIAGWVGTIADVTAEAGAEAAMSDARDKATAASKLKSDFIANMSHEIRTPMNGVIGMTDLLLETDLDPRQRDYAQTVRNSGEALMTIIDDILDFSKVEAGKLEIEAVDFDLRAVVDDVVDLMASPAEMKSLELIAVTDRSIPALVRGDPGRLRQILTNLLGNAIKFTHSGEVMLRVTGGDGVDAASMIRFEVRDTGDGIPPEKLAAIFQPFVQADSSTSRKYGGTGLGLAICSQLVALMGGDCGVSSVPGAGSTFWFTIAAEVRADQAAHRSTAADADLAGVSVLVADDNATVREVLADQLESWGMTVTTADGSEAALAALRTAAKGRAPIAIALLDCAMTELETFSLKAAILADPDVTARVILMIGLGEERHLGPVAESGVRATLIKPVHVEDLHHCVRIALGLETAALSSRASMPDGTRDRGPTNEPCVGRILLAEDNLINQKVALAMLTNAGYEVDTVLDGVEAVEAATTETYDAILMDCQMPQMSGYEATAAIRIHEDGGRHTPIIAMTAGARREDRERCLAEGMDAYLAKPVSKDALLALLLRSIRAAASTPAPVPPPVVRATPTEVTLDPSIFHELRALGEAAQHDLVTEVSEQFLTDTEPLLVELRDAAERGDAFAVGRIAHRIKGGSSQLGGRRLASACTELERAARTGELPADHHNVEEVEMDFQELRCELLHQMSGVSS